MASLIVVEDEQVLGQTIQAALTDDGHQVHWVASAEDASDWMKTRQVDLALIDLRLPRRDGISLLEEAATDYPDTVVIIMTAHADVHTAVRAMKLGAADFLTKPVDLDAISLIASKNLRQGRLVRTWKHEQRRRSEQFGLHRIIGQCPEIQKAKAMVARIGRICAASPQTPPNVFLAGETGTGKDLIARALHYEGPRQDGPFVHVNCAALPEALAESELFGHVKGAFTDARTNKRGLFELADQGTLFLDEICSLSLPIQAKLLTAIETRRIRSVGAAEEKIVDLHLISAINRDPQKMIAEGRFRDDLYHRLRVIQIDLPPLRERGGDLELLADHLIEAHCRAFQLKQKKLTPGARRALGLYHWPGNIRELSHRLETAVLLSDDHIDEQYLPERARRPVGVTGHGNGESISVDFSKGPVPLEAVERQLIERALARAEYNICRAADLLDVSRDTLRYRMEKHGLENKRSGAAR